jgi:malonyl CoA-acyl carrier protein transacylase
VKVAYLFPGQGSQKKGMGADYFEKFPDLVKEADACLGYSIRELCEIDPGDNLRKTQYTQPAIYVVSALSFLDQMEKTNGKLPDFAAGHSIGEYSALFAAGCFDFVTGLKLVARRGEIMSRVKGGGMAAVAGMSVHEVESVLKNYAFDGIDMVNYNTSNQTVIAGLLSDIEEAAPVFEEAGARMVVRLKVSGAFHSRYMDDSAHEFTEYLNSFQFSELRFPVIANCTARPYSKGATHELLSKQLNHPVRWCESIQYMLESGECEFTELGGGRILSQMLKHIHAA